MDLILRNASLPTGRFDIGVANGRIAAIAPRLQADAPEHDAAGCLVCAGLCESHIHLEKSRIIARCAPEQGRDPQPVPRISAIKPTMTVDDIVARGRETLEACISNGATRMRAHVEVDPRIGLRGLEGVKQLARDYAWAIDIELCVFPQEGLTNNPGTDELLVAALRDGATVLGAAPGFDPDPAGQLRRIFALAHEFDVDLDLHLDSGDTPDRMDIPLVCDLTDHYRRGGRVTVSHMTRMSTMKRDAFIALARRMATTGIAVTVLPATDLFMTGRDQTDNIRRGLADATLLAAHGVRCTLSTNNVLNPFTPYGDCSLIRMVNLQANCCQISTDSDLAGLFSMISDVPARTMNLTDYGIAVGNPADLVVIDAASPAQAVAELRPPRAVWKRGRRTVTRDRPVLHRPH